MKKAIVFLVVALATISFSQAQSWNKYGYTQGGNCYPEATYDQISEDGTITSSCISVFCATGTYGTGIAHAYISISGDGIFREVQSFSSPGGQGEAAQDVLYYTEGEPATLNYHVTCGIYGTQYGEFCDGYACALVELSW